VEDIDAVNEVLKDYDYELCDITIKANNTFKEDNIDKETLECIKSSLPILRYRLDPNAPPRPPEFGIILDDDAHDWQYIYEALFMG
jgi:hypothetical protein